MPTKNHLAQRISNKQRKNEYLKKKALTKKEIETAISGLSNNDQILHEKVVQIDNLFGLYLEFRKEAERFSKFVTSKVEEFEQQRSENKDGA